MKTSPLLKSIKRSVTFLMFSLTMIIGLGSCSSEELVEDDIVGEYIGGSEDTGEVIIRINKNSSNYDFYCKYEDWSTIGRANVPQIEWRGTFESIESNIIKDSKGTEIGKIKFTKGSDKIIAEFTSFIEPKKTFRAQKGGEMADLLTN